MIEKKKQEGLLDMFPVLSQTLINNLLKKNKIDLILKKV